MATLSTHVLDTAAGRPAAGVAVRLESRDGDVLDSAVTDDDGRVGSLGGALGLGGYVLRFDTGAYVERLLPRGRHRVHGRRRPPPPRAPAALAVRLLDLPWQLISCVRARRVVVGDAEVAACVEVTDGRIAAVTPYDRVPSVPDRGDARRRRGAAARAGRHPRARQRAGPHRVGGLRDRDPGGRGGRRDHDPGHAAQLGAGDDHGRRPGAQALGRRGAGVRRRGVLGRSGARQPRRPGGAARGRGVRLQVLPAGLRRRRVPAPAARRVRGRDGGDGPDRRADDRARRGRLAPRRLGARRRALRGVPGLAPARGRGGRDRAGARAGASHRRPGARGAPVGRGRRTAAAVRPAPRAWTSPSRPARTT